MDGGTLSDSNGILLTNLAFSGSGTVAQNTALTGSSAIVASGGTLDLKGSVASTLTLAISTATASDLKIDGTATTTAIALNNANQTLEIGPAGNLTITPAESYHRRHDPARWRLADLHRRRRQQGHDYRLRHVIGLDLGHGSL